MRQAQYEALRARTMLLMLMPRRFRLMPYAAIRRCRCYAAMLSPLELDAMIAAVAAADFDTLCRFFFTAF